MADLTKCRLTRSPIGQAAAQLAQDKNTADHTTALEYGTEESRRVASDLRANWYATCDQASQGAADSQLTTVQANQMKANLAADFADVKPRPSLAATAVEGFTKC